MGSILIFESLKRFLSDFFKPDKTGLSIDEIKKYLPKYLSDSSYDKLLDELKKFPNNSDKSYYTTSLNHHTSLFQGDALSDMPFVLLPQNEIKEVPVMILSNSCSINKENQNPYNDTLIYAPIHSLSKYLKSLEVELSYNDDQINSYEHEIKNQNISSIFFLPSFGRLEESIVRLDYISSCHVSAISDTDAQNKRLFSLSNVGFYLFLFKLSIHFTRILEKVDRDEGTLS